MDWTLAIGSINFGIFDLVTVAIVLISGIAGIALGFSRSALKMLSYVLSLPLALLFVEPLSEFIRKHIEMKQIWASLFPSVGLTLHWGSSSVALLPLCLSLFCWNWLHSSILLI